LYLYAEMKWYFHFLCASRTERKRKIERARERKAKLGNSRSFCKLSHISNQFIISANWMLIYKKSQLLLLLSLPHSASAATTGLFCSTLKNLQFTAVCYFSHGVKDWILAWF
jgi:hypothetical protein